jgi:hypothetical protein
MNQRATHRNDSCRRDLTISPRQQSEVEKILALVWELISQVPLPSDDVEGLMAHVDTINTALGKPNASRTLVYRSINGIHSSLESVTSAAAASGAGITTAELAKELHTLIEALAGQDSDCLRTLG